MIQDYGTAMSIVELLESTGVNAYVAYENGWQVWMGFYSDRRAAENDISNVKKTTGYEDIAVVEESNKRVVIYDDNFNVCLVYGGVDGYLQVRPKKENDPYLLSVNGKRYRNYIEIRRYTDSDMTLINIINIEQYLYGVVPAEIEADAPLEAVKAQAVAARTYTYRNLNRYSNWGFDLTDTVSSQVYNGYDSERQSANRAVDETKGKKMLYNGNLAHVYYFASSGGMTANVKEVWGSEIPYLVSVEDPYESETSSHYIWQKHYPLRKLRKYYLLVVLKSGIFFLSVQKIIHPQVVLQS